MPRIESTPGSSGGGWNVPYKALALVALISCGIGYIVYEYEQLNPSRKSSVTRPQGVRAGEQRRLASLEKLNLTPEQKEKVQALAEETTNSKKLRRQVQRILTPEQKARARNLQAEAKAKRELKKRERQERLARLYPGTHPDLLQAKQKEIRARAQARRQQSRQNETAQ